MGAGSEQPAATKGGVELADIFRAYGESYRRNHPLPVSHLKVIEAVERCRTGPWATSSGVTPVALSVPPITPAVTAIAPSANRWPR